MALMRVYCGLAASEPVGTQTGSEWLTAAVVDDAGRLLDICDFGDDAAGYAELGALLAERSGGGGGVAVAADSDEHQVTLLLAASGRPLAIVDDETLTDYADRFADDESADEIDAGPAERHAVGLARALQAGALAASSQPPPREMMALKPVLAAHAAVAAGRHGTAVALREVLRELYPAALRAYPDPAEAIPLAILDALPEPGLLGTTAAGRGRDAAVATELAAAGLAEASTIADAITSLRVAISETPRRTGIGKGTTAAVAETIREAVAAVRACDAAVDALVGLLAAKPAGVTPPRPLPAAPHAAAPVSAPPISAPPVSGPPAAGDHPARTSIPRRRTASADEGPAPANWTSSRVSSVRSSTRQSVRPASAPPAITDAPAATEAPTGASPIVPAEALDRGQLRAGAAFSSAGRAATRDQEPAAEAAAPPAPAASPAPETNYAARLGAHTAPAAPQAETPPASEEPPANRRSAPSWASEAAGGYSTVGMQPAFRPSPYADVTAYEDAPTNEPYDTAGFAPSFPLSPDVTAPGNRQNWPLNPPTDDDMARVRPEFEAPTAEPAEPQIPRQRDGRVSPPWQSEDIPAEPPSLRLVDAQSPTSPPALRLVPGEGRSTRAERHETRGRADRDDVARDGGRPADPRATDHRATDGRVGDSRAADSRGPDSRGPESRGPDSRGPESRNAPEGRPTDGRLPSRAATRGDRRGYAEDRPYAADQVRHDAPSMGASQDDDLLIFAQARSAWFDWPDEETPERPTWTDIDEGWSVAARAEHPDVDDRTDVGLPRRVPQANLVPGSPLPPIQDQSLRIVRDPASMAAHTTGYFRGSRRGEEVRGYAVGGRSGRESGGSWDFSREGWDSDRGDGYRPAVNR